jgi:hypothetical protein
MGRREMTKKIRHDNPKKTDIGIAVQVINLSVIPSMIQPLTTFGLQPTYLGCPIMREDFITTTGFMPPKLT